MTDTIQKIADDMQNWRSLPAWQVDQLHNRLRALSARASAKKCECWYDSHNGTHRPDCPRASAGEGGSAEDRFEQYVATLIAKNPDVQKLGERLADWLDEDRFNSIEPILTGIAQRLTAAPQPAQAGAGGGVRIKTKGPDDFASHVCPAESSAVWNACVYEHNRIAEGLPPILSSTEVTPASPATGMTDCRVPHSKYDPCHNCEPDDTPQPAAPQPQEAPHWGNLPDGFDDPELNTTPAHGDGEGDAIAPWPDFAGNQIRDRDRIRHPDGTTGTVLRLADLAEGVEGEAWRVVYGGGDMSRLSLQIGDKGQAVVVTTRPTPEAQEARDAARWRALIGSARIRVLGSAGLLTDTRPDGGPWNGYAHIGLELWTKHEAGNEPSDAAEWLTKYADAALALPAQGEGDNG